MPKKLDLTDKQKLIRLLKEFGLPFSEYSSSIDVHGEGNITDDDRIIGDLWVSFCFNFDNNENFEDLELFGD